MSRVRAHAESGQSTAEYATGVVGAACIGGILVQLGQGEWFTDLIRWILNEGLLILETYPLPSLPL